MRIFAFGDTHGSLDLLDKVINKIKVSKPDVIICSGDLTNFGNKFEEFINKFPNDILMLIVPGNHESNELLENINNRNIINLHKKSFETQDYIFFGYGEGGFSYLDKDFEITSKKFIDYTKSKKVVLITHAPPFDSGLDYLPGLGNRGNKSIRSFIDEVNPILCICGHLHENAGKLFKLKNSFLINPGPLGKLIEI